MAARASRPLLRTFSTSSSNSQSHPTYHPTESLTIPIGSRQLGYSIYGAPRGYPLIFLHGYPSSRIETCYLDRLALNMNIKIYTLERPGFGISTYQEGRGFTDYPSDVLAFAKAKKLEKFALIGASGGGPYAISCAHMLPKGMLTGVGVFAGAPPWAAGRKNIQWWARYPQWLAVKSPFLFRVFINTLDVVFKWFLSTSFVTKRLDKVLETGWAKRKERVEKGEPKPEDELGYLRDHNLTTAQRRERLLSVLYYWPFNQGTAAMIQELYLMSSMDWGFKFEDVEYSPIKVYHGKKDINAPIENIRWMCERLPGAELQEFEGTHFTLAGEFRRCLEEVVGNERDGFVGELDEELEAYVDAEGNKKDD